MNFKIGKPEAVKPHPVCFWLQECDGELNLIAQRQGSDSGPWYILKISRSGKIIRHYSVPDNLELQLDGSTRVKME